MSCSPIVVHAIAGAAYTARKIEEHKKVQVAIQAYKDKKKAESTQRKS
jgi:hypothetical protein